MRITLRENSLILDILVTLDGDVRLLNLSPKELPDPEDSRWFRLLELQVSGQNQDDNCGSKHTGTQPGSLLRYAGHEVSRNRFGAKVEVRQRWQGLTAVSHFQFYDSVCAVRSWIELISAETETVHPVEYLSSFRLAGILRDGAPFRAENRILHIPHHSWYAEAQWQTYTLAEMGAGPCFDPAGDHFSMKRAALSSNGTWPAGEHLPMGALSDAQIGDTVAWQIETAGSWNWEISTIEGQPYLALSGPSQQENSFVKLLKPGETFVSVPCALAWGDSFEQSIQALTQYRRRIRRPNADNAHPSVIYNDYMNCLWGDPTTEKELPLIKAAAEAGCKYYCVDCGWYSDGPWWDGVGEWLPSKARFPEGIRFVLDQIRAHGMVPGLWLELEVMGIQCPLAKTVPPAWFFQRNGHPVICRSRYQLDFRNPEVIRHADSVIDRLVDEYGVGYIKMDYNINAGVGTDVLSDSVGEGLLSHTHAYLAWLDRVLARYPELVIENCGSGGMRMEYSLLSRLSIQSVTDQTDYRKMAAIACNCPTAVTPEQAAIWSYPLPDGDEEETIFNMVNALLLRVHQSGFLPRLSPARQALVWEGLACHKAICERTKTGLPFWPIGLGSFRKPFLALGMDCGDILYLAVWHVHGEANEITLPLPGRTVKQIRCLYPEGRPVPAVWTGEALRVQLQPLTARVFELKV